MEFCSLERIAVIFAVICKSANYELSYLIWVEQGVTSISCYLVELYFHFCPGAQSDYHELPFSVYLNNAVW